MPTELEKAIESAATEITTGKKLEPEQEPEGEPEVQLPAGDEESEEEQEADSEPDLSDTEADEARRLYKALRDPKTAGPIVAALAQQFKVDVGQLQTKKDVIEAKTTIKDAVKEALGTKYEFLADQLGSAIEKALEIERQSNDTRFAELQQSNIEREVVTAYDKLSRDTKGESKRLEARMASLAEEIPIGKQNVETYIRRLYDVASAETKGRVAARVADKIRRNAGDAPSRLRATPAGTDSPLPTKKMNLNESVAYALEEITKGKK